MSTTTSSDEPEQDQCAIEGEYEEAPHDSSDLLRQMPDPNPPFDLGDLVE